MLLSATTPAAARGISAWRKTHVGGNMERVTAATSHTWLGVRTRHTTTQAVRRRNSVSSSLYLSQGIWTLTFTDQPWIALTRCDPPDDAEWAPCEQEGSPTTLQNGASCSCTDAASTTIAFTIGTVIPNTASLPRSMGQSIQFMAGHFPTSPPAPGPSGSGTNPGSGSGSPGPTPTGSGPSSGGSGGNPSETDPAGSDGGNNSSSESGMSQGTKIAIGVGVSVGVLVLLAALVALFILRRRRSRGDGSVGGKSWKRASATSTAPTVPEADGKSVSEADGRAAAPWTMRSELEGRQVAAGAKAANGEKPLANGHSVGTGTRLDNVAELPGSEAWPNRGR